jgi:hypothetical protein
LGIYWGFFVIKMLSNHFLGMFLGMVQETPLCNTLTRPLAACNAKPSILTYPSTARETWWCYETATVTAAVVVVVCGLEWVRCLAGVVVVTRAHALR